MSLRFLFCNRGKVEDDNLKELSLIATTSLKFL